MKNRIIIISQSLNQPRVINRIKQKAQEYQHVEIYSFIRDIYDTKNYEKLLDKKVKIHIVGKIKNEVYFSRFFYYFKLCLLLLLQIFKKKDVYSFGIDCGLIAQISLFDKKFYEISDIKWLYKKGLNRRILMNIDYFICRCSTHICFTSEGFYDTYYSFISPTKITIIENKFISYNCVYPIENIRTNLISIAYVGALRYPSIVKNVIKIISENNNILLHFYGDGGIEVNKLLENASQKYNNIFFYGKFKNPDDLENIYINCNINFVCYDNNLENELVALPNKYYESGFFNIPIVCSTKTSLSKKVLGNRMGWAINPDFDGLKSFFDNITLDEIIDKHNNIKKLDKNLFVKI
jgi:hypothetical protein